MNYLVRHNDTKNIKMEYAILLTSSKQLLTIGTQLLYLIDLESIFTLVIFSEFRHIIVIDVLILQLLT